MLFVLFFKWTLKYNLYSSLPKVTREIKEVSYDAVDVFKDNEFLHNRW